MAQFDQQMKSKTSSSSKGAKGGREKTHADVMAQARGVLARAEAEEKALADLSGKAAPQQHQPSQPPLPAESKQSKPAAARAKKQQPPPPEPAPQPQLVPRPPPARDGVRFDASPRDARAADAAAARPSSGRARTPERTSAAEHYRPRSPGRGSEARQRDLTNRAASRWERMDTGDSSDSDASDPEEEIEQLRKQVRARVQAASRGGGKAKGTGVAALEKRLAGIRDDDDDSDD